jgi:flagellar basal-body rod protein FlgF
MALSKGLDVIAQNIANQATTGFRAGEIKFSSLLSTSTSESTTFSSQRGPQVSVRPGEIRQTGNAYDIAVSGDAWLAVQSEEGIALTRDGRLHLDASGELKTASGYSILDTSGSAIQLRLSGNPPSIARNGNIIQDGITIGSVGLFQVPSGAELHKARGLTVVSNLPPVPIVDPDNFGILQGFIEKSNVNPVIELTQLINLQRRFEAITAGMSHLDSTLNESFRNLLG